MCDTLYLPASADGRAFFGKNSDRNPDEPQVMSLTQGPNGPCLLSRPVWMRGAEMGMNSHGLIIGNEAVFARRKPPRDGTLGMDILRSALEQARTAEAAVAFIANFVETHDQGGNGAYKGSLFYDNSYLVADWDGAWIIETAGHRWTARRADGPAAISNAYSITDDFERADPRTLALRGAGFSWKRSMESRLYPLVTKGDRRRACALAELSVRAAGDGAQPGIEGIFTVLRSHGPYDIARPNMRNMESICMHEGGLVNNATTASMAVQLDPSAHVAVIWYTAQPSPCLSLYRPAILESGAFRILWTDYDHDEGSTAATEYWRTRRAAAKRSQRVAFHDLAFAQRRDAAQRELLRLVNGRTGPADDARISERVNQVIHELEYGS